MKKSTLLILCLFLVGCSLAIPTIKSNPTYPDFSIAIERGPCFGTCPIYTVLIGADGTVNYEGEAFVKVEGKRSSKITSEQIEELVTAIQDADFFSLEDQYVAPATDLPSITLTITLNGRTKSIRHYGMLDCSGFYDDAPPQLCELENTIDEVANSDQWVVKE